MLASLVVLGLCHTVTGLNTARQPLPVAMRLRGGAVQAVAAMFGTSPLALAAMPGKTPWLQERRLTVGAHEDTIELMRRIVPRLARVRRSARRP